MEARKTRLWSAMLQEVEMSTVLTGIRMQAVNLAYNILCYLGWQPILGLTLSGSQTNVKMRVMIGREEPSTADLRVMWYERGFTVKIEPRGDLSLGAFPSFSHVYLAEEVASFLPVDSRSWEKRQEIPLVVKVAP